ncbi:MAG TPA: Ig-like domain-containing protein, partial [Acidimicrobiales bacterium]
MLIAIAQRPAAAAPVVSLRGYACGYQINAGFFGGPANQRGCVQTTNDPEQSASPSVTLPPAGSPSPLTATDADGALGVAGPATLFGGIWPLDILRVSPSGPISVSTEGTPGGGSVTSSTHIRLWDAPKPAPCWRGSVAVLGPTPCTNPGGFGPGPVEGDDVRSTCTATSTGVTGSATFANGFFTRSILTEGPLQSTPDESEPIPNNPPVNYTRSGVMSHVGDHYAAVFNEHIVNSDGSLTINAAHMYMFGPVMVGHLIIGQVTCGTTPSALSPLDTVPPTCADPMVSTYLGGSMPREPQAVRVGVFDTGGLAAITTTEATNVTVTAKGGDDVGSPWVPGGTWPSVVEGTRIDRTQPTSWAFDLTDTAGNTTHCRVRSPVAAGDSYSTSEDTPINVPGPGVLANDTDPDGRTLAARLAYVQCTPSSTSFQCLGRPKNGIVALNRDGSFTYTPNANFHGVDSFTYNAVIKDPGLLASNPVTVPLTVNSVNDAPVAVDDTYATDRNTARTVAAPGVVGNDTDADGDALSVLLTSAPGHGTVALAADGSFTYTPAPAFHGTDSFTYAVSDGQGSTDTGLVSFIVGGPNQAPVAVDDAYATAEDTPLVVAAPGVVGNDTDAEDDTLSAGSPSAPAHGTVAFGADGSFTYTPAANYAGPDAFTYKVNDGEADSNVATVALTVTAVNDAPTCSAATLSTDEDVTGSTAAACADVDGDTLSYTVVGQPAHGAAGVWTDDTLVYTPEADYNGTDAFTYTASDGATDSNVATVAVTVNPVNDAPVANPDSYTTASGTALSVPAPGVLGNDTDVDGDPLIAGSASTPANGTVTLGANGSFTYSANPGFSGTDTFTYSASDANGGSSTATVTITVRPPPAPGDTRPTELRVNDVAVAEGNAGTTAAVFTIARSGNVSGASTVKYKTSGGTATAASDYTAMPLSTATFAAGETSKTVSVAVTGDTAPEANETLNLVLSTPTGATVADTS